MSEVVFSRLAKEMVEVELDNIMQIAPAVFRAGVAYDLKGFLFRLQTGFFLRPSSIDEKIQYITYFADIAIKASPDNVEGLKLLGKGLYLQKEEESQDNEPNQEKIKETKLSLVKAFYDKLEQLGLCEPEKDIVLPA